MILFFHFWSIRLCSRRFPLSILSLAAVLEGQEDFALVDGNVDADPLGTLSDLFQSNPGELLAVSVMFGPQMVAAMQTCREIRCRFPRVPIVWGGYFPSLYPDAALNAS